MLHHRMAWRDALWIAAGGAPGQTEQLFRFIRRLAADSPKLPVYSFVEDVAASGGWVPHQFPLQALVTVNTWEQAAAVAHGNVSDHTHTPSRRQHPDRK